MSVVAAFAIERHRENPEYMERLTQMLDRRYRATYSCARSVYRTCPASRPFLVFVTHESTMGCAYGSWANQWNWSAEFQLCAENVFDAGDPAPIEEYLRIHLDDFTTGYVAGPRPPQLGRMMQPLPLP